MTTVVNYSATLRTRNKNSIANAKTGRATQEFYNAGDNYAGIILFSGMNLTGKVITGLQLTVTSASSGYGASSSKTVYLRKALYQNDIADGVTGAGYAGDALGTFTGSFYNNTNTNTISGELLSAMGAYISQGNNAFVIYNPSPHAGSQGWSTNYLQWTSVTLTDAYEEAVSAPTTSASSVNLGSAVTIFTNRTASTTTHTITFAFGNSTSTIGTNVGSSLSWTPPLTLASQIPNAISGICTITCYSYSAGSLTGTRTCKLTLTVTTSVKPEITNVSVSETVSRVEERIGSCVKLLSRPHITITANGVHGSTIASYRTVFDGITYTDSSFNTNKVLSSYGTVPVSVTVTDSRGRTATYSTSVFALNYSYPSITQFKCERSNVDGSAAQVDGTHVRYTFSGGVSPIDTAAGAIAGLGGVKKTGDTMTGNLTINNGAAPSLSLQPNYNDTINLIRLEGSYAGLAALSVSEDSSGTNRRTLQIRNKALENSLNNAALLLNVENGTTAYYRLYHEGQNYGIPITKGGTGAVTAATARSNLGCDNASNLSTGTIAMARLPFKMTYGSGSVAGNSALVIDYSSASFTTVPCVVVSYSTTGTNWSGDNGALKIHSKTATGAIIIVGGSFNNLRQIDWIAVGV